MLSICVPTYNRVNELSSLLESIPDDENIEVLIIDDGSTDSTRAFLNKISTTRKFKLKYEYQENSGRAHALCSALTKATSQYSMIMDSDDHFIDGWWPLLAHELNTKFDSYVFGTILRKDGKSSVNLPPTIISNFLELRADYGVQGDLKEVVKTQLIKQCLYSYEKSVRRVPTSLIWAKLSNICKTKSVSIALAKKEYLPGGMTDRGRQLRIDNPQPMLDLNSIIVESESYKSTIFRVKSALQWARYANHIGEIKPNKLWQYVAWIPGLMLYLYDKRRLF